MPPNPSNSTEPDVGAPGAVTESASATSSEGAPGREPDVGAPGAVTESASATSSEGAPGKSVFAYYPAFRRIAAPPQSSADEVALLFEKFADRVQVRGTYSATGFRPDTDLLFWWVADSADAAQDLLVEFRRTTLGMHLELTYAFLGVTRPAEFNPDHLPSFLKGEPPRRYLTVYPFVRTEDWYLMPAEERSKLLRDHGQMGREFPEVAPNTTSAFGLGDWEWILAFEADDLTRIVDCIRRLREAEARRYTKLDVPFVLGIRSELREAVERLS